MASDILKAIESEIKNGPVQEASSASDNVDSSSSSENLDSFLNENRSNRSKSESSSVTDSRTESRSESRADKEDDGEDGPTDSKSSNSKPDSKPENSKPEKSLEKPSEKLSRRQLKERENAERFSLQERRIQELNDQVRQYSEMKPFIEEMKRVAAERKIQEQQLQNEKLKNDPQAILNQIVDSRLSEVLAPVRQQQKMQEIQKTTNDSIKSFREWSGSEEVFNGVAPIMKAYLQEAAQVESFRVGDKQLSGHEVSELLAQNPRLLYNAAYGEYQLKQASQRSAQEQENLKKKQDLAKLNASISKPNQIAQKSSVNKSQARNEINDFLLNYSGQRK
jgi:hypothetical protein